MPFNYQLTWLPSRKRWRKRYKKATYYLKTPSNGKRDREGYHAAVKEWERLKAFIDGIGPDPYTKTGAIIPERQLAEPYPVYVSPAPAKVNGHARPVTILEPTAKPDNPFILGTGFHPELLIQSGNGNPHLGERRISVLADAWLDRRHKQTERGELSLKQWAEDRAKLQVFRDFIVANFPQVVFIEHIEAAILNLYRDKQWEFIDHADKEHRISKATLKKRLDTVAKWLHWLLDQNILAELPKDLRTFGRVKLDKPKPLFWSPEDVKKLATLATERTQLYIMLALNLGATQKDIATLEREMIDWETGIVARDRHKTGVASKAKLWPSALALLREHASPDKRGPLLLDQNGTSLYVEKVNDNGKLVVNDTIRLAFDRLMRAKKTGFKGDKRSFKHLRKTAANEIEKSRPDLTGLFLAHAEKETKRYYVEQHYDELFVEVAKLESVFGFAK